MSTLRISKLLLELYACPAEHGRWPAVLDQLCRSLRVRSAVIQILLPDGGRLRSSWMVRDSGSEAAAALHDRYFSDAVNPRMMVTGPTPVAGGSISRDSDLFAPNDPLFADLKQRLAATGLGNYLSASVPLSASEELCLVLHRDANDTQDYNKREERLALDLMPHLGQAVQLGRSLHQARGHARALHETMDSLRFALLLCNADGSLDWSNEAAARILAQRRVLWLNGARQLTAGSTMETHALRKTIAKAAVPEDGSHDSQLLLLGGNGPGALQVSVQGLDRSAQQGNLAVDPRGKALLVLSDPTCDVSLPPDLLKRLFGLSPTEARLASALCVGSTLNEYAAQAGVTISTARYQLKQVMAKAQVSKQSQLVQRLCTSVIFHVHH